LNARASFPGTARLRSPAEFAPALKGRRLARGALFSLSAASSPQARLGLVIGKRFAPLSVTRSAIKRVLRESFRLQRETLPPADYVIRLHGKVPAGSLTAIKRMVRAEADAHWGKARKSLSAPSSSSSRDRAER